MGLLERRPVGDGRWIEGDDVGEHALLEESAPIQLAGRAARSSTRAFATCRTSSSPATCSSSTTPRRYPAAVPAPPGRRRADRAALRVPGARAPPRRTSVSARRGGAHGRSPPGPGEASWVVELRSPDGVAPHPGRRGPVELPGGATATIVAPYAGGARLWLARIEAGEPVEDYLLRYGHPIRYGYVPGEHPLRDYQTTFALEPGSAEMPSAARPFTPELVTALVSRGVQVAPITLHAGVSSPEHHEPPIPERFDVPEPTARLVNAADRVIAVGTTVVRALETVAQPDGTSPPATAGPTRSSPPTAASGHRRPDHRLARAAGLPPPPARRRPWHRAARGLLRRGPAPRLPLARVRRQPARPSVAT